MTDIRETTDFDHDDASSDAASVSLAIGAPVRVGRLETLPSVRAELSRLYRECRRRVGRYPTPLEGQRLASILGDVRGLIELEAIAGRLAALEAAVKS
jgi:hypothetical protein